jgi:hypothetical protein
MRTGCIAEREVKKYSYRIGDLCTNIKFFSRRTEVCYGFRSKISYMSHRIKLLCGCSKPFFAILFCLSIK